MVLVQGSFLVALVVLVVLVVLGFRALGFEVNGTSFGA